MAILSQNNKKIKYKLMMVGNTKNRRIDMEEKFELLEQIHNDSSMGVHSTEKLLEKIKDKDNKIKGFVEDILRKYKEFAEKSKKILEENNKEISELGVMAKIGSSIGISKEVKEDNSDSAIADMLIQGISMGSIEMEKKIKEYEKEVDKEHKKLAKEFLNFQEKTIEKLKKYL